MTIVKNRQLLFVFFICSLSLLLPQYGLTCSRVLFSSNDDKYVVTGRSMDWFEDIHSNIWLFPRGMNKHGATKQNTMKWTSKYGSVIVAGFDVGTTDGLNEKGLMVNLLYLGETDFGSRDSKRKGLSWSIYSQYLLDNFANVKDAVNAMKSSNIQPVASPLPGSVAKPPTVHFSLSDAVGDSAIFEYINGKLVIHHGKKYRVMTNSPTYDQQLALNAYWETVGGDNMLPGTRRAADRFVRASYYVNELPNPKSDGEAIAYISSIMRNVSVPFGKTDKDKPNIAPTIWRTAANHKQKIYYYESTFSPSAIWVDLKLLDFKKGSDVKKLTLDNTGNLSGDVTTQFQVAKPFKFAGD